MSKISPQPRFRALDNNGDPLSGGKLYTYEAGTTTPKVTYTDSGEGTANTNPVILDSDGYADVWLGDGSYKFVLDDSTDVLQWSVDDLVGDASTAFGSSVITQSTNLNITSVYNNNVILCTASLTLTLLSASVAGEGFYITVKNTGSGTVTIDPDASETIDGSLTLSIEAGASAIIICNGTSWTSLFLDIPFDINGYTSGTIELTDEIVFADVDDSNEVKKDTVQGIVDLVPNSTETVAGVVEKATNAEMTAGTADKFPDALEVKGYVDSASLLSQSYDSGNQTITSAGGLTLAHGFSSIPKINTFILKCTSAEHGYSVGDEVVVHAGALDTAVNRGFSVTVDTTNFVIKFGAAGNVFTYISKTTGGIVNFTNGSWEFIVRGYA